MSVLTQILIFTQLNRKYAENLLESSTERNLLRKLGHKLQQQLKYKTKMLKRETLQKGEILKIGPSGGPTQIPNLRELSIVFSPW